MPLIFLLLILLTLLVLYQLTFFLVSILKRDPSYEIQGFKKIAILVPAHNEEKIISILLNSLKKLDYPQNKYESIVIADNCNDMTADVVRKNGFKVLERNDREKLGKGYALAWAFEKLKNRDYDVFVIIDADTRVNKNFLKVINQHFNNSEEVVQARYGTIVEENNFISQMMFVSDILQFDFYSDGKYKLGLSCRLVGNGMCFSKTVIQKLGWTSFSITENNEHTIKLALEGYKIAFAKRAIIETQQVRNLSEGKTQRTRWIMGRQLLLIEYLPKMLFASIKKRDIKLFDTMIEMILPSYSMQINFLLLMFFILFFMENLYFKLWYLGLSLFYIVFIIIAIKKANLGLKFVPHAIGYLFWKLFLKIKVILQSNTPTWIRTTRH